MEHVFGIIYLILILAFILGLMNPKWVFMSSRKKSSFIYFIILFCASAVHQRLDPTQNTSTKETTKQEKKDKPFKYIELTLQEYKDKPREERKEIVNNYVEHKKLSKNSERLFYNCISQISYTKASDLKLNDTLGWCYTDFIKDPNSLNDRINFDTFISNFSGWTGEYRPLIALVKESMIDDDSYKHVETSYTLVLRDKPPYAIVRTTFKGKNVYGATIKNNMQVKVDIATGKILEIISQ